MRISKNGTFLFSVNLKDYNSIVELYLSGISTRKLAKQFNCSRMTIQRILSKCNVKLFWNRKFYVQDDFFNQIDTEAKAYILGFLYADGYNNEKMGCLEVALQEKDTNFLKKIAQYFTKKPLYRGKNLVKLSVYSKQISLDLKHLGCPQTKSLILTFPSFKLVPENLLHHFMRGYFDGDGCIYVGKSERRLKVSFDICGTQEFLEAFKCILQTKAELKSVGCFQKIGNIHRFWIQSKADIRNITKFLYTDATIYLERKRIKMLSI